MGAVPVFLAVQGPGQPDAHGVALLGFGQVVAHQQKQAPHQHRDRGLHMDGPAHGRPQGQPAGQHRQHRNDPQADVLQGGAHVGPLGVLFQADVEKQIDGCHQARDTEHGKGPAGPAVWIAIEVKMGGHLLRQAAVQRQPRQDGQQADSRGEDHPFCFSFHGHWLLSGLAATAGPPPERRR